MILDLIKKHKKFYSAAMIVSVVSLIYVLSMYNKPISKQKLAVNQPSPYPTTTEQAIAQQNKEKLLPKLPIYIEQVETSVGIKTDISIFTLKNDAPSNIHIEIFNIDYFTTEDLKGPNVLAFQESFLRAKALIEKHGVRLKDMYIIYGQRAQQDEVSRNWVKELDLLD